MVNKDSAARAMETPAIHQYMSTLRKKLLADGVLTREGDGSLRLTKDYVFQLPSTAAGVVLARAANGS